MNKKQCDQWKKNKAVITNVRSDEEWIKEQQYLGHDPKEIIKNIKDQLQDYLKLEHDLSVL